MIEKQFVKEREQVIVRVTFRLPKSIYADAIYLVGDFNNWNRTSHRMRQNQSGEWVLTVELEVGHAYQFRYLRNREDWLNDPAADAYVCNAYGSDNFVVITDPEFKRYVDERSSRREVLSCRNRP